MNSKTDDILVDIREMNKIFRVGNSQVEALRDVELRIDRGEFIAIMGPSGSGKSTLLNIIGCLDRPTSGIYYFSSRDVSALSDVELSLIRATRIGFVFQTFNLIHQLTVLENIEVPFAYQNIDRGEGRRRALKAIKRVGLDQRSRHHPSELSGGELQRAAIARAISISPSLILADEPTGNLDSVTGREIMNIFTSLNQKGSTILLVTHDEEVAGYAARKLYLSDGRFERCPRKQYEKINPA